MLNVGKLTQELLNAGIAVSGCNSNGVVWGADGTTEIQNRADVKAILTAHDPTPDPKPGKAIKDALKNKTFAVLTNKQKDDLLLLLCVELGICDKDGNML